MGLVIPLMLGLLTLAAVPVLIHWLTRQKVRSQSFPALILLQHVDLGRSRPSTLRDWLILACRSLAIVALVLAAAGLVWRGQLVTSPNQPAVIILDASASMQQINEGATAWSRARAATSDLLSDLSPRPVSVIIAGSGIQHSTLTQDYGQAQTLLAESSVSAGNGSIEQAFAQATTLLEQGGDMYFITDLARSSLSGIDPSTLPESIALHVVNAGGGSPNLGITRLEQEPAQALAGQAVTIRCRLANYTSSERTVTAMTHIGAQSYLQEVVIPAHGFSHVETRFTPDSSGSIPIRVNLSGPDMNDDALAIDNERCGTVTIRSALTTWLVTDGSREDPAGAVLPLHAALLASGFEPQANDGSAFTELLGSDAPDLLVSAGLDQIPTATGPLAKWLQNGGTWIHVIASEIDPQLQPLDITPPMVLGEMIDVSSQEAGQQPIGQARLDHALLKNFVGRENMLTDVAAFRYRLTPQGQAADAAALWAYSDGSLALAERPVGLGRWFTLNCSPAAADSNLGDLEVLPLLLSQLPQAMLPQQRQQLARPIGIFPTSWESLEDPNGQVLPVIDGQAKLEQPGVYRGPGGDLVAAAIAGYESDLRQLDPKVLNIESTSVENILQAVDESPLWQWCLFFACLLLISETMLVRSVKGARA